MSIAILHYSDNSINPPSHGKQWRAWLPSVVIAILAHAGVWAAYTWWQTAQTIPQPLPAVQITLVSNTHEPIPEVKQPAPPQQHMPPAEKQPVVANKTETPPPPVASNNVSEEPAAATESKEVVQPEAEVETTPPVYQAAYLNNPPPTYPLAARRRGIQGTVLIRAQIMEDGKCREVSLSKSSGYEMLDQAALAAVKSWRFTPAKRGTQNVSAWVVVPITFHLSQQGEQTQSL